MYQGASEGGECPLVVDSSTPSCGTSRFGCWVCTVVEKDRSMEAMIKNDEEKVWMTPLLELRNELDKPDDRDRRDFRRMTGRVQLMGEDRVVPGPYTKEWRETWLRRVLEAQVSVRQNGPAEFRELTLITPAELHEIRRIWLYEKHEFDDRLPRIYTISKQRLSEGEKQIFAISVLWGLARASARPLPAVIDTPMARLDVAHRTHLVERYFPNASHQVVIFSTDTEVDRHYYEVLGPFIARAYHLNYDEEQRRTVGEEGYFW